MGVYFSRHNARQWDQCVAESRVFSIWEQVEYSPLTRERKLLIERGSQVEFRHPQGVYVDGDVLALGIEAKVSLLAGVDACRGHFFAGLLFTAQESSPHMYCREISETTLVTPVPNQAAASEMPASKPKSNLETISEAMEGMQAKRAARRKAPAEPSPPLLLEQFAKEPPRQEFPWTYMLLYAVKEGVLVYYSNDFRECEDVVRNIASRGAQHEDESAAKGRASPSPEVGRKSPTSSGAGSSVKVVEHEVAKLPNVAGRLLVDSLNADLPRRFVINPEQDEYMTTTNCVVFAMRVINTFQQAVRGFDIKRVCEEHRDLGSLAGQAASAAWERLWRRVKD